MKNKNQKQEIAKLKDQQKDLKVLSSTERGKLKGGIIESDIIDGR